MPLLVALRLHGQQGRPLALEAVLESVAGASLYADRLLLCVAVDPDLLAALTEALAGRPEVVLQVVEPWGRFTFALNVATHYASDHGFDLVAFQSLEMQVDRETVSALVSLFDDERVIVAGPVLAGHEFRLGTAPLRGRTCPWNTFAIWRVAVLGLTGFPLVADGREGVEAGVEEVSAVALLKHLRPDAKALLVAFTERSGIQWNVESAFEDPERRAWHERKMKSKDDRPARHLELLGLPLVLVEHVEL